MPKKIVYYKFIKHLYKKDEIKAKISNKDEINAKISNKDENCQNFKELVKI